MLEQASDLGLFEGLGQALQFLRSERGLTQPALAEATRRLGRGRGVGKTSISGYERGHSAPTLPVLAKLLDAMGVNLSELGDVLARVRNRTASTRSAVFQPVRTGGGAGAAEDASPLPAYLVVDLREAGAQSRRRSPATRQQILDLVDLARSLVETPSVLGGEEPREPVADGTHGDDAGHEGGES